MDEDKFAEAGRAFQSQQARNFSACDQALARLVDIERMCKKGIERFYAAAALGRPDVYVDMPTERQLRVAYGFRPGPQPDSILRGPFAAVVVMPDASTMLASDVSWTVPGENAAPLIGEQLRSEDWENEVSDWLVDFLTRSEQLYREYLS
jgi:hypothetical protein